MTRNTKFYEELTRLKSALLEYRDDVCALMEHILKYNLDELLISKAYLSLDAENNNDSKRLINYINSAIEQKHIAKTESQSKWAFWLALISLAISAIIPVVQIITKLMF